MSVGKTLGETAHWHVAVFWMNACPMYTESDQYLYVEYQYVEVPPPVKSLICCDF